MMFVGEIPEGIAQRQGLFLVRQHVLADWRVTPLRIALHGRRQSGREPFANCGLQIRGSEVGGLKVSGSHGVFFFFVKRPVRLSNP
jgi:hypothetical protein